MKHKKSNKPITTKKQIFLLYALSLSAFHARLAFLDESGEETEFQNTCTFRFFLMDDYAKKMPDNDRSAFLKLFSSAANTVYESLRGEEKVRFGNVFGVFIGEDAKCDEGILYFENESGAKARKEKTDDEIHR